MTIRSFPEKVVYGDPLYIEIQVVNRGNTVVRAAPVIEGLVQFGATDEELSLSIDCSLFRPSAGLGFELIEYAPGQKFKFYFHVFVPKINHLDHVFWRGIENHAGVRINAGMALKGHTSLSSDFTWARIVPRDPSELEALRRWSRLDLRRKEFDTKLLPGSVGSISLYDVRTRQDTKELAEVVKSGELGSLLQLTLRLQELEASIDKRDELSLSLVEWVSRQPDIKRQWLAKRLGKLDWLISTTALKSLADLAE